MAAAAIHKTNYPQSKQTMSVTNFLLLLLYDW